MRRKILSVAEPWNAVWVVLFLLGVFVLAIPEDALAGKGADNPRTYGGWGNPTREGVGGVTLAPFNEKQPEIRSIACVVNGKPLARNQIAVMSEMAKMAYVVSEGKLTEELWGGSNKEEDGEDKDNIRQPWYPQNSGGKSHDDPWSAPNYGFATGTTGVRNFMKLERTWLLKSISSVKKDGGSPVDDNLTGNPTLSAWSTYANREFQSAQEDTGSGDEIWVYMDADEVREEDNWRDAQDRGFPLTVQEAKQVASYINLSAPNGLNVFKRGKGGLPDGCINATFDNNLDVSFGTLFDNPDEFFVGLTVGSAMDIVSGLYEGVSHDAWSGLMHTAHTERGDMIWDIDDKCLSQKNRDFVSSRDPSQDRTVTTTTYGDTCQNNTPLGFSKENTKVNPKDRPFYLDLAALIAWLITGTYFVILFASAVVFIYRGNRSQSMSLMKVAPKLLLSIMLAIAATFLIGAAISVSNWVTMAILDTSSSQGSPINTMNIMLSTTGQMLDLPLIPSAVMTLLVATITLVASFVFLFGVVIKQLMLIVLIVLAPIAIFCLVVDSWRPQFMRWLKSFGILLMIPIGVALIMQLGVLLNPVMGGSVSQFLSVFMLVGTVVAMAWMVKTGLSIAITGKNVNFMAKGMQAAGAAAGFAGKYVPGGFALGALGKGASALGQKMDQKSLGNKLAGALVPEGRAAGAGAGGGMLSGVKNAIGDSRKARKDKRAEIAEKKKGNDPSNESEDGWVKRRMNRMRRRRHASRTSRKGLAMERAAQDPNDSSWIKGAGIRNNLRHQIASRGRKFLGNGLVAEGLTAIPIIGGFAAGVARSNYRPAVMPTEERYKLDEKGNRIAERDADGFIKKDKETGETIYQKERVAISREDLKGASVMSKAEGDKMRSEIETITTEMQQEAAAKAGYRNWKTFQRKNKGASDEALQKINQTVFDRYEVVGGADGMRFDKQTQTYTVTTTQKAYDSERKAAADAGRGSRYSAAGMSEGARQAIEEENLRQASNRYGDDNPHNDPVDYQNSGTGDAQFAE